LDYRHVTKYNPPPPPPSDAKRTGRKPQGERALTGAERQARYRQRQVGNRAAPPPRPSRPIRRSSRPQQWHAAVARLVALQAEYAVWFDALPEALRDGATGEALQAIVDLDLGELVSIEPPRGFGRD
jgi:ferric-dicitrate binding protein FerR (iron transport regulator)